MKKLFTIISILISSICFSQSDTTNKDNVPFTVVEQMPYFLGGQDSMKMFLKRNIVFPKKEQDEKISGICYISFVVEKDGTISNIKVMRGVKGGKGYDDEAMRVVALMPKWIPGKQNNRLVRVQFYLPIKFSLQ